MNRLAKRRPRRAWAWRLASVVLACALVTTACGATPNTDPPQNSGGTGSASAGAGSGGLVSTAGTSGLAGAGFTPTTPPDVNCEIEAVLSDHCGPGCHSPGVRRAGLDLSYDSGLVGRIKDVAATHREIACNAPGQAFRECVPPHEPAACIPFTSSRLVDSDNVEASWILKKVNGTHGGCGMQMPAVATGYGGWAHDCLQAFVRAVAELPR
jgi:hypothetical protein